MPLIQEGRIVAGKYRLERTLARGGMGSVWMARHVQLDMLVAIKFMDAAATASDDARARFEREAKAAAQIQSPHVVHVHDYGMEGASPYIVMEMLQGEDLGTRLRREKRLPLFEVSRILTQVAKALRKAHDAGLVHRDLKPANIFLARTDDDEEVVKVLDFGVVKVSGRLVGEVTQTGIVVGSVHYMSPEQARGARDLDFRSDVWSLGVLAFRALVGQHPFPGEQIGDVIVKVCSEPIPRPSDLAPDLSPEVDAFFVRALARNPAERFPSARDFANALAMLAGTAPIVATGAWPIAPAARLQLPPAFNTPPPPRAKASVILEVEAIQPQFPPPGASRRKADSDTTTEDATRVQGASSSEGTLTHAPRVSDVAFPRASVPNHGTKLIAATAAAVTLLVGGLIFFWRGRMQAPPPPAPAATPVVMIVESASAELPPPPPPSSEATTEPAPPVSASATASSRPTRPPKGPPAKGTTTKKINSTLGI